MDSLLDFLTLWFATSLFIIATGWYVTMIVPPRFPRWWKQVVVDVEPIKPISRKR